MAKQPMTDAKAILKFMFAGSAIFTLRNVASGNHLTFHITEMENKNPEDKRPPLYSVGLLKGPDNLADYTYIGIIINRKKFKTTDKSKLTMDSAPCKALAKCLETYVTGRIYTAIEFWHIDRCGKCGRPLTDDESILIGLGPDCAASVGVQHGNRVAGQAHPAQAAAVKGQVAPREPRGSVKPGSGCNYCLVEQPMYQEKGMTCPNCFTHGTKSESDDKKYTRLKKFRDLNDDCGDAKFLALSDEAGITVEDWFWFSQRERKEGAVLKTPTSEFQSQLAKHTRKSPPPASAYSGVNNGFRSKSEEPVLYAPAEISEMVKFQKENDPDKYYSIKQEGMTEDQIRQFWYRRFESIPLSNFKVQGRTV